MRATRTNSTRQADRCRVGGALGFQAIDFMRASIVSADHYRVGGALDAVARVSAAWRNVSADHYRVGGALAQCDVRFRQLQRVSADHYRVGGALGQLAMIQPPKSPRCQPIITASGGRSSQVGDLEGRSPGVSRSLPRRGGAPGANTGLQPDLPCQPIITASGGRSPGNGAARGFRNVSADHYRVGGALQQPHTQD